MQHGAENLLIVRPSLRFDIDFWKLRFDTEGGLDWDLPQGGGASGLNFFLSIGVRHDF